MRVSVDWKIISWQSWLYRIEKKNTVLCGKLICTRIELYPSLFTQIPLHGTNLLITLIRFHHREPETLDCKWASNAKLVKSEFNDENNDDNEIKQLNFRNDSSKKKPQFQDEEEGSCLMPEVLVSFTMALEQITSAL